MSDAIENVDVLYVPSITLYEVFKKLLIEADVDKALLAVAHMKQGRVIDLNDDLAVSAAIIGNECKLPLADSVIYATAKKYNCILWTQDKHFRNIELVKYIQREE